MTTPSMFEGDTEMARSHVQLPQLPDAGSGVRERGPGPKRDALGRSADQRRTARQLEALHHGKHPLGLAWNGVLPLHANAAPADDRTAPGNRCGNCAHRTHNYRAYPKCDTYATRGPGTDCRAWWPACIRWEARQ